MRGRWQIWLAVVLCIAVFVVFLVHKPACSSGNMLHNKPVPKFRALTASIYVKSGIGAVVEFAVARPMIALLAPQPEEPFGVGDAPAVAPLDLQVLSCCLLC